MQQFPNNLSEIYIAMFGKVVRPKRHLFAGEKHGSDCLHSTGCKLKA